MPPGSNFQNFSLLDIGSGLGRVLFTCTALADLYDMKYLVGIESSALRLNQTCAIGRKIIGDGDKYAISNALKEKIAFVLADVTNLQNLIPFTHIYCFSKGFGDDNLRALAALINKTRTVRFIVVNLVRRKFEWLGFKNFVFRGKRQGKLSGSGEVHMFYFYEKRLPTSSVSRRLRKDKAIEVALQQVDRQHNWWNDQYVLQ